MAKPQLSTFSLLILDKKGAPEKKLTLSYLSDLGSYLLAPKKDNLNLSILIGMVFSDKILSFTSAKGYCSNDCTLLIMPLNSGFFTRNSKINYNNRVIEGDSLTFDDSKQFASATRNIVLTDTLNKTIIKGNYAEVFKAIDSAMITKKSIAIKMVEKDSLFIKADTLFAIGPAENRIIKGRYNVKYLSKI